MTEEYWWDEKTRELVEDLRKKLEEAEARAKRHKERSRRIHRRVQLMEAQYMTKVMGDSFRKGVEYARESTEERPMFGPFALRQEILSLKIELKREKERNQKLERTVLLVKELLRDNPNISQSITDL